MSEAPDRVPPGAALDLEPIEQRIRLAQRIFGVSFDGYPDTERAPVDIQRDRDRWALMQEVKRLRAALDAQPPQAPQKKEWWSEFHHLWTKAVGTPDYVKDEWMKLENLLLRAEGRRAQEPPQ